MHTLLIDYKSDFDILLILYDKDGVEIPVGDVDFSADFTTSDYGDNNKYSVSKSGDKWVNCSEDHGRLRVSLLDHRLNEGTLKVTFTQLSQGTVYSVGSTLTPRLIGVEIVKTQEVFSPVTDTVVSVPVRDIATEVPSEEYMADLILKGYTSPGTVYFLADPDYNPATDATNPDSQNPDSRPD